MKFSQEDAMKKTKASLWLRGYTNDATAQRFSSTSEYTDQYITDSKNPSCARFTFLLNELSIDLRQTAFQYSQYTCKAQLHPAGLN
jgi:hypothetical protein